MAVDAALLRARSKAGGEPFVAQRLAAALTGSRWFWVLFVLLGFAFPVVRSLRRELPEAPPILGMLPRFALTDQSGRPFGATEVEGRLLLCEFASAATFDAAHSPMSALQRRVRNAGDRVRLVTFLDGVPLAGLEALGRKGGAGLWRWTLAGGEVKPLAAGVLASLGPRAAAGTLEGQLLLVDGRGRIRRVLPAGEDEIDLTMRDIGLLVNLDGK